MHTLINTQTAHPIPPPRGVLSQELNGDRVASSFRVINIKDEMDEARNTYGRTEKCLQKCSRKLVELGALGMPRRRYEVTIKIDHVVDHRLFMGECVMQWVN
jgi:hypothetical protein